MRRNLLLICFNLLIALAYAQTSANVVIFSEQGERFQVVLNGLLQNEHPQTNVKVQALNAENYFLKVMFEDISIPELDQNFFATPLGYESTYKIKKSTTGKYVIRPVSSIPFETEEAMPGRPIENQEIVIFNPNALPFQVSGNVSSTNMSTNMNVGGVSFSTDINYNDQNNQQYYQEEVIEQPVPVIIYVPGYTGQTGCMMPMDAGSFSQAKSSISSKSFEDDKLKIAKQIVNNNCVTTNQVKDIIGLFSFESSRVDFAKYCWTYTYDVKNYYLINDAFSFSSSIDELNDYMAAHPITKNYSVVQTHTPPKSPPRTPPVVTPRPTPKPTPTSPITPPTTTPTGKCSFPMSDIDFNNIKNTIRGQIAEDSKFKVAKQLIGGACFRSAQIKELLDLLSYESNRLELAKKCYSQALDPQSYYLIDNALTLKSSRDELEAFILTQK